MAIPKIIHQTARDFDSLPDIEKQNIENLKALNPGWEHRFYSDADIDAFVRQHYGDSVLSIVKRISPEYGVVRADLFRYMVTHREGGVYLDIKSTALKPLDEVLRPDDHFLLSQWDNRLGKPFAEFGQFHDLWRISGGEFQQWQIVAAPNHPFLRKVVQDVLFNIEHYSAGWFGVGRIGVLRVSGPIVYTLAIAPMMSRYRNRIVDIEDLGFRYSIPGRDGMHWDVPGHYRNLRGPVVQPVRRGA